MRARLILDGMKIYDLEVLAELALDVSLPFARVITGRTNSFQLFALGGILIAFRKV